MIFGFVWIRFIVDDLRFRLDTPGQVGFVVVAVWEVELGGVACWAFPFFGADSGNPGSTWCREDSGLQTIWRKQ